MNIRQKLANDIKSEIEFYVANIETLGYNGSVVKHLESKLNRNGDYLSQTFRQFHKKAITTYSCELKIQRAKQMLENGEQCKHIMVSLHFANEGHLSRTFKQHMGITMRDFRQLKQLAAKCNPETMFLI